MIQNQSHFGGGINKLLPAHRIPDGASVDIVDAEVFDGTLKPYPSFGGEGGGEVYFYEAGNTWVGSSGFADRAAVTQLIVDSSTGNIVSSSHTNLVNNAAEFISPLRIADGFQYKILLNHEITILTNTKGLFNANSFVEYNQDLYVGRDAYNVDISSFTNNANTNTCVVTLYSGQIDRLHEGDEIVASDLVPNYSEIISIDYDNDQFTLNNQLVANTGITRLSMNATPIRVVDGNLNNTYPIGLKPPEPTFAFEQTGNNTDRSGSHTTFWYSSTGGYYPIPYQYGLSQYDSASGAESSIGELTDPALSAKFLQKDSSNVHLPLKINISDVELGSYAFYRTGGTSSVLKKVATLYLGHGITITASLAGVNNQIINVVLTNLQPGRYQVRAYPYNGSEYNHTPELVEDEDGNGSITFSLTKTVSDSAHYCDIFVDIEPLSDPFKRVAVVGAVTIENGAVTNGSGANNLPYLDFIPPQALIDIQPITQASLPPTNMKHLTEVNNFFFGVHERVLYVSRYADPNNWPLDGYINFDNTITALSKRGSDLLVYTTFNLYRVFGSSPESMRKVRIPTIDGIPGGLNKCVQPIGGGVIYLSQNGLQYFNGAEVTNITKSIFGTFTPPSQTYGNNVSGVYDNQYYLLSPTNDGYIVDMRQGVRISRTSLRARNLHYRGNTNKLYNETGYLGGGTAVGYDLLTRSFDGGDRSKLKVYRGFSIVGEDYNGAGGIDFLVDGQIVHTFNTPTATRLGRTFRLPQAAIGMEAQIQLRDIVGRTMRLDAEMDLLGEQTLRRWDFIEVQYTGGLIINFLVDGELVIDGYQLSNTLGDTRTAQIFFPPMTEGEIGHLFCEETEDDRILRVSYQTDEI